MAANSKIIMEKQVEMLKRFDGKMGGKNEKFEKYKGKDRWRKWEI